MDGPVDGVGDSTEQPLPGRATAGVVRVGDTVRRPVGPWTDAVDALLTHLQAVGFPGAPPPLGCDAQGRQVLEFVPGQVGDPSPTYSPGQLRSIGALLADYHRAVATFVPPPGAVWNRLTPPDGEELICHGDAAPWNLVASAHGFVLIDWDGAAPGTALWDLAYTAQTVVPLAPARPVADSAAGLRTLVDGYGLDDAGRARLVDLLARRSQGMVDLLRDGAAAGRQPWARLWVEDGPYWVATTHHLRASTAAWRAALL